MSARAKASAALVLIIDDVDVPLPKPLLHTVAVIEPTITRLGEGELASATPAVRLIPTVLGEGGYNGPRPIKGHGPHRYRFHVFALDRRLADSDSTVGSVLRAMAGHILAHGVLTGTHER